MNGGAAFVETLLARGVDTFFTVPGESFLMVLEALRTAGEAGRARTVGVRHEGGGAFAACAYGRLAAKPACLIVSRGPGATNAAIGVHTAQQESVPLILAVGQVPTASKGREAFQEIDPASLFASLAKAILEPKSPTEVAAVTARAADLAVSGRPGPVVIVLPKDITEGEAGDALAPPPAKMEPKIDEAAILEAANLLRAAKRPILLAGELLRRDDDVAALMALAEASAAPVMAAYRQQDHFPNAHPAYGGHLEINRAPFQRQAWEDCDLVVAAGARLDGISTEDFRLLNGNRALIQLFPDEDVARGRGARVAVDGDPAAACRALAARLNETPPADRQAWRDALHREFLAFSDPAAARVQGPLDLAQVAAECRRQAGAGATIVTDAGSFSRWFHRFCRFDGVGSQAGPMSGAMGYAVPGGLGAALARPGEKVIAVGGDASFLMTSPDLATIAEEGIRLVLMVCDNGAHGSILESQRGKLGDERAFRTHLRSPDFAVLARAHGIHAETVTETAQFPAALAAALAVEGPALLHLKTDIRDVSPFGFGRDAV